MSNHFIPFFFYHTFNLYSQKHRNPRSHLKTPLHNTILAPSPNTSRPIVVGQPMRTEIGSGDTSIGKSVFLYSSSSAIVGRNEARACQSRARTCSRLLRSALPSSSMKYAIRKKNLQTGTEAEGMRRAPVRMDEEFRR